MAPPLSEAENHKRPEFGFGRASGPAVSRTAAETAGAMSSQETDQQSANSFIQAFQLYQMLQQVNTASTINNLVSTLQVASSSGSCLNEPAARVGRLAPVQASSSAAWSPPGPLTLPMPCMPSHSPPKITPPATPPTGVDASVTAVLAQLSAKIAENLQPVTAELKKHQSSPNPPVTPKRPAVVALDFFTPKKLKPDTLGNQAKCSSPVDNLPSGLKRLKVRVLQNNSAEPSAHDCQSPFGSLPTPPRSSPVINLVARLAASSQACTPGNHTGSLGSPQFGKPDNQCPNQLSRRLATLDERLNKLEEVETRSPGGWTEQEKRELIRLTEHHKPCGAASWEEVAQMLHVNCHGSASRRGSSAERMYRTLTDPSYSKSANKHGRRLNPRKGSTPMHVMATYSLQQLPDNEGNLTQITELIAANERFAAELDWTPRPGTKTYPRWKDALVGCFKPGRYPHLVKTDRKRDGLNIYKLLKTKFAEPQRLQLEQAASQCEEVQVAK